MRKYKCVIIDDEELARKLLENYISRNPELELCGEFANAIDAIPVLKENPIDILFLDIQMPEISGVDFIKILKQRPSIVFTTAYSEYALEGYQLDITDYLLKPFSFDRFVQATNKCIELIKLKSVASGEQEALTELKKDYLLVKSEHKIHKIRFDDIQYIQSMREYVAYYTPAGRILSLYSLKKLEVELPQNRFVRIHKSYIVATDQVTTLEGNMVHVGDEKLPIGNSYKEEVLKRVF